MAAVHDLGAEDGEKLALEILFPKVLVLFAQLVEIHLAVAAGGQIFQRFGVVFVAVLLELSGLGHDGGKLLFRRHVRLVFPLFLPKVQQKKETFDTNVTNFLFDAEQIEQISGITIS